MMRALSARNRAIVVAATDGRQPWRLPTYAPPTRPTPPTRRAAPAVERCGCRLKTMGGCNPRLRAATGSHHKSGVVMPRHPSVRTSTSAYHAHRDRGLLLSRHTGGSTLTRCSAPCCPDWRQELARTARAAHCLLRLRLLLLYRLVVVVVFASQLNAAMLTHRAECANAPIWSPPSMSSRSSVVAMIVAFASSLIIAGFTHRGDRTDTPICGLIAHPVGYRLDGGYYAPCSRASPVAPTTPSRRRPPCQAAPRSWPWW